MSSNDTSNLLRSKALLALLVGVLAVSGAIIYLLASDSDSKSQVSKASKKGLQGNKLPAKLVSQPAPRIRLTDSKGRTIDTSKLKGRPYAVTFVFTRCPDVCPLVGQQIRDALRLLKPGSKKIPILAISVDPRGDTAAEARRWIKRQHLPANVYYLLGSEKELKPVWQGYFAQPQLTDRPETSTHTASIWLVDRLGRRRTSFSAGADISPATIAHDIKILLNET